MAVIIAGVCMCDVRLHLLEEQLRETEIRAASILEEEQRRSREIVVRVSAWHFLR